MTLEEARIGDRLVVSRVRGQGAVRRRLLDLGVLKGTVLTVTGAAPLGDPMEVALRSYTLTLRRGDAALVEVTPAGAGEAVSRQRGLDRLLLHPVLALPVLGVSLFVLFWFSIHAVGGWTAGLTEAVLQTGWTYRGHAIPGVRPLLAWCLADTPTWAQGFLLDGLLEGVGTVLGFLPQLAALFLCLSFLEGSGYLSRGAYLLDRLLRPFGLSGGCVVPYTLACGCAVPGVLACRTIQQARGRQVVIRTASFLPCGAKLPLIALMGELAFPGCWWLAPGAYSLGMAAALFTGWLCREPEPRDPFVLELPPLRLPALSALWAGTGVRLGEFLKKAGTLLPLASAAVWTAASFGPAPEGGVVYLGDGGLEGSLLALLGRRVWPLFALCGWGDWRSAVACLSGLLAKESVVGTLAILGIPAALMTPAGGLSFLLFNLFCPPCVAAVGAMGQELGSGRALLSALGYQLALAFLLSVGVYQAGCLLGFG